MCNTNYEFSEDKVRKVLEGIREKHFFTSEMHFKIEFIMKAKELNPDFDFYPEYVKKEDSKTHYDLLVITNEKKEKVLFEFKYLTDKYSQELDNGITLTTNSNKNSKRKYDCWRDIERIENCIDSKMFDYGYFILITNSSYFWNKSDNDTCAKDFSIAQGMHRASTKSWRDGTSDSTKGGRDDSIVINNNYQFTYEEFYDSKEKNGHFQYLIVPIGDNEKLKL